MANMLYGYFVLPESLLPENRRRFDWKRANPLGSLRHLTKYPVLKKLTVPYVLIFIAGHANQSTWTFYTIEKFHWNETWVGYSLGAVGIAIAAVQGGLIRVVIPRLGQQRSAYAGLIFYTVSFILFAFATEGWMMFLFIIPSALGGFTVPALQGIVSTQVPADEQGELQGTLTSLISLTSVFGPLLMTYLFAQFSKPDAMVYFPGAPFLAAAVLAFLSLILVYRSLQLPLFTAGILTIYNPIFFKSGLRVGLIRIR
jgi:DHA1 family tetracycline resistance protein-like MFS transporter